LKTFTNQIEAPSSDLFSCNADRSEPKLSPRGTKSAACYVRDAEDPWWKEPCTKTVSEDGDGSKKCAGTPMMEQLHRLMKALGQDTYELDWYLDRREPGWNDLADRVRGESLEKPLWEGLVSKTKEEAIEMPRREDLVIGAKIGDGMIGGSKVSELRTFPCPVRDDEGQSNYRQRGKKGNSELKSIFFCIFNNTYDFE